MRHSPVSKWLFGPAAARYAPAVDGPLQPSHFGTDLGGGCDGLKPVIDRRFAFAEAPAAYRHLASGAHLGKIVIGHDEAAA